MKDRINAFWNKHFGAELFPADGTDVAIEESHVQGLEEISNKLEALEAENLQLKEENQEHAMVIDELTTANDNGRAFAAVITAALEANNVEVPEGASAADVAAEKITAWGKTVPAATAPVATTADDLGDGTAPSYLTEFDKRVLERNNRNKK